MSSHEDNSNRCVFFFADGRRCQLSSAPDDMGLCYFHAHKYRQSITAQEAGRQVAHFLNTEILTACDLSAALSTLFSATAQGYIKPKTAATLAYLGQLMLQAQRLAKDEYQQAFKDPWHEVVQNAATFNLPDSEPSGDASESGSPAPGSESPSEPPDPDETERAPEIPPSRKIM